jgi:hypothetical protein
MNTLKVNTTIMLAWRRLTVYLRAINRRCGSVERLLPLVGIGLTCRVPVLAADEAIDRGQRSCMRRLWDDLPIKA